MKQIAPDLWQSSLYQTGILNTHAYFLERPSGNVLFYNTGDDDDLRHISEHGGVAYQLLTHRDEAGASQARIRNQFGSKLGCSIIEAPFVSKHGDADLEFGEGDHRIEDIDIIHTPGHTDGSICFLYTSPYGKSYLFSGDTIFQWNGEWSTFVLPDAGGSEAALAESLKKLRGCSPDIVMSSGFVGDVPYREVTREEWTVVLDDKIGRLTASS